MAGPGLGEVLRGSQGMRGSLTGRRAPRAARELRAGVWPGPGAPGEGGPRVVLHRPSRLPGVGRRWTRGGLARPSGPGEALRSRHSCSGVSGSDLVVSERRASRLDLGAPVAAKGGVRPCSHGHGSRWGDQGGAALRALTFVPCRMAWRSDACVSVAVNCNEIIMT